MVNLVIQYQDLSFQRIRCPTLWKQLTKIIWLIALFLKPSSDGHFWCYLDRGAISLTSESNFCSSRWVNIGHHATHPSLLFSSLSVKRNRDTREYPKREDTLRLLSLGGIIIIYLNVRKMFFSVGKALQTSLAHESEERI